MTPMQYRNSPHMVKRSGKDWCADAIRCVNNTPSEIFSPAMDWRMFDALGHGKGLDHAADLVGVTKDEAWRRLTDLRRGMVGDGVFVIEAQTALAQVLRARAMS